MTTAMIGAAIGLAAGIIQFVVLQRLVTSQKNKPNADAAEPQTKLLSAFAWIDLAMFPAIGWFVGTLLQTEA